MKVADPGVLLQYINSVGLSYRRSGGGGDIAGETLVLRGDVQKSYILIVRKPSVIISSVYEKIEQVLSARYEGTKQMCNEHKFVHRCQVMVRFCSLLLQAGG